jgi:hypothetical protein
MVGNAEDRPAPLPYRKMPSLPSGPLRRHREVIDLPEEQSQERAPALIAAALPAQALPLCSDEGEPAPGPAE